MPIALARRTVTLVLLALLALAWVSAHSPAPAQGAATPDVGDNSPLFEARDMAGKSHSLAGLIKEGRPSVVFFWALRCAPCLREMAFMNELQVKWKDSGLAVLAVESNRSTQPQIVEILDKLGNIDLVPQYPVLPDVEGKVSDLFGVVEVPVTYVVGADGKVLLRLTAFSGEHKAALEAAVEEAVTGRRPRPAAVVEAPTPSPGPPSGEPVSGSVEAPSITRAERAERAERAAGQNLEEELEKNRYFGDFHYNREEFDKAEGYYRKVVELAPRNIYARLKLGEIFVRRKDRVKAREIWEEILRIEPGNAEAKDYLRRLNRGDF